MTKISLEEARKRATPGKLGDALGVLVAESGERLPLSDPRKPFTTDEECANAALLAHCWNTHDELVAALENLLEYSQTGCVKGIPREDELVLDSVAAVLARAKKV